MWVLGKLKSIRIADCYIRIASFRASLGKSSAAQVKTIRVVNGVLAMLVAQIVAMSDASFSFVFWIVRAFLRSSCHFRIAFGASAVRCR